MNTIIIIILLLLVVIAGVVLIPRVRFSGEIGAGFKKVRINNIWFLAEMDFRRETSFMKIFSFRIHSPQDKKEDWESKSPDEHSEYNEPNETIYEQDEQEIYDEAVESDDTPPIEDIPPKIEINKSEYQKSKKHIRLKLKRKPKEKKLKSEEQSIPWSLIWQERDLFIIIMHKLINSLRRLFRTPYFDLFRLKLNIASPDPALTGVFYGAASQLKVLEKPPQRQIIIKSDFDSEIPSGDLKMAVSICPLKVIFESLYMALRLPWIRIFKVYRKWKKSVKEKDTDTATISTG